MKKEQIINKADFYSKNNLLDSYKITEILQQISELPFYERKETLINIIRKTNIKLDILRVISTKDDSLYWITDEIVEEINNRIKKENF